MTSNKKPPVPYAERLARESVKFGLRLGGSLLRHTPGLLKIGVIGMPLVILGAGQRTASTDPEDDEDIFNAVTSEAGLIYDEHGEPHIVAQNELDDYNHGLI